MANRSEMQSVAPVTALDALQRSRTAPQRLREPRGEREPEHETRRTLRCRACGATVTDESEWVSVAGRRVHRRINPFGFEFEFGCFRTAPGARTEGSPTAEHTWFPGYSWILALCASCGVHLGWQFQGGGPPFHALILDALVGGTNGV